MDRPDYLVARFYAEGARDDETERARLRFWELRRMPRWARWGIDFAEFRCDGTFGYHLALRQAAEQTNLALVVVEHDMMPTEADLAGLLDCDDDFCACAYRLYPKTTNCSVPVWAHRNADGTWIDSGQERAGRVGLGVTLLTVGPLREALRQGPWEWGVLDDRLSKAIAATWHVHWPAVEHLHR